MGWTDNDGNLTKAGKFGIGATTSALTVLGDTFSGFLTGSANRFVNRTHAEMNDILADMAITKANRQSLYSNQDAALKGWGADRELAAFLSRQNVASAASGTGGPGDKRLQTDAINKAYRQKRDMLTALMNEHFERNLSARSQYYGYKGKARQLRTAARHAVGIGLLSGFGKGVNNASNYLSTISTFWKKGSEE